VNVLLEYETAICESRYTYLQRLKAVRVNVWYGILYVRSFIFQKGVYSLRAMCVSRLCFVFV